MSYSSIEGHHSMFYDELRNRLYLEEIQKTVNQDSVVLDLGAGLGLHGFMANNCSAKQVYLVEPANILDVAKKVVEANGHTGEMVCLSGEIERVSLPEKVDVIISVFTGNFLLTEDLLPSLFYARDKYLRPGGKMIPDRANMIVVPVSSPEYYLEYIDCWSKPIHSTNYSLVRQYAANTLYYDKPKNRKSRFLAEPSNLLELDFMTATDTSCHSKIEIRVTENGTMHGCLGWFDARIGDKWLSTSPKEKQMHWSQVFLPLENPINVKKGDVVLFELTRPEFGDWSWIVEHNGKRQKHSTFLSQPRKMKDLLKLSKDYKGKLSQKGMVTQEALRLIDGHSTANDMAQHLFKKYPQYFKSETQADLFVEKLMTQFT